MPDIPEMARAYLLLGRIKKRFENDYNETYDTTTQVSGIPPELEDKIEEYNKGEPAAEYYYNGYHFDKLIELFPDSEYVDDAAFEKTNLLQGGECEGDENCSLDYGVDRYIEFLKQYPASDLAGKAIEEINKGFDRILSDKSERIAGTQYFSIKGLEATIDSYQKAVQDVAPREKAKAEDVICALWLKTGEKDKAIATCNNILKSYPQYPPTWQIKARLGKIQTESFELKPPKVVGYLLAELHWELVKNATEYSIYRSTEGSDNFALLGAVSGVSTFQDKNIYPATNYVYYIKVHTGSDAPVLSNSVTAQIPSTKQGANFAFYNEAERSLDVLGAVYNSQEESLPALLRVSDEGKVSREVAGSFYGYFETSFDKYTDSVFLIDPIHQKYLRLPKDVPIEKSLRVIKTQDPRLDPYPRWAKPGKYSVSIGNDNQSVRLTVAEGGTWPKSELLAWDFQDNESWEVRGRYLIGYSSLNSTEGNSVFSVEEENSFKAIYPDERDGSVWAVGTTGNFYKVSRIGQTITRFKEGPVAMSDQVAFNTEKSYAWIMNVDYNNARKTSLRKISLKDGSTVREIKAGDYIEPDEAYGNFTVHISLDRKTENLWIYNEDYKGGKSKVIKLSPEGKVLLRLIV